MATPAVESLVPEVEVVEKYLLGKLEEKEVESLEELMFSDDYVFEQVQAMQDELIDRYLSGTLSEHEKIAAENRLLSDPENRQKLRTTAMLRKHALESFKGRVKLHLNAAAA